uniref:Uncharacterized protein n=1 Tax=Cucumis melo TaxID=3656 RepID=A0A9I9DHW8_CUCME
MSTPSASTPSTEKPKRYKMIHTRNPLRGYNALVNPPVVSRPSSTRRVKSIKTTAIDSNSFDEDHVLLSEVLKRKTNTQASTSKQSSLVKLKNRKVAKPSIAIELYEELFGTPPSDHRNSSSRPYPPIFASFSFKAKHYLDKTMENLFDEFYRALEVSYSRFSQNSSPDETVFESIPSPTSRLKAPLSPLFDYTQLEDVPRTTPTYPLLVCDPTNVAPTTTSNMHFRVPLRQQKVVTKKSRRCKLPPNVHAVPIGGISVGANIDPFKDSLF